MEGNAASVERQRDKTISSLTDKLGKLENRVAGSVESVTDSVMSVHDALNIKHHIRRRPWTMMAGAAALGFIGAARQSRHAEDGRERLHGGREGAQGPSCSLVRQEAAANGDADRSVKKEHSEPAEPAGPGWLANLGAAFEPQLAELKGIAIGTILSVVHEMLAKKDEPDMARSRRHGDGGDAQATSGRTGAPPT